MPCDLKKKIGDQISAPLKSKEKVYPPLEYIFFQFPDYQNADLCINLNLILSDLKKRTYCK